MKYQFSGFAIISSTVGFDILNFYVSLCAGGIFKKGMVMLQSNSLTFLNVPKFFYKSYCCKKILTRADISFQVGGAMSYLKNILSHHKLNAFNTNIGNNLVGVFFNFVKEFENKIGAFIAMSMRLLKNNFHCSNNLPNCQERKELTNQIKPIMNESIMNDLIDQLNVISRYE